MTSIVFSYVVVIDGGYFQATLTGVSGTANWKIPIRFAKKVSLYTTASQQKQLLTIQKYMT